MVGVYHNDVIAVGEALDIKLDLQIICGEAFFFFFFLS